ncbi:B-cell linker protein-like isoform X2 [Paramacrobiotus metropolitanus]|nr:B-cell linker protein-like isoform X2 [Paramacrobiotus metropolitanus]
MQADHVTSTEEGRPPARRDRDKAGLKGIFETLSRRRGRLSRMLSSSADTSATLSDRWDLTGATPVPVPVDYSSDHCSASAAFLSATTPPVATSGYRAPASAPCNTICVFADEHILPDPAAISAHAAGQQPHRKVQRSPPEISRTISNPPDQRPSTKPAAGDTCDWGSEFSDSDSVDSADGVRPLSFSDTHIRRKHHLGSQLYAGSSPADGNALQRHIPTDRDMSNAKPPERTPMRTEEHAEWLQDELATYACPEAMDAQDADPQQLEENIYELPDEQKAALVASIVHGWRTSDAAFPLGDSELDFVPPCHPSLPLAAIQPGQLNTVRAAAGNARAWPVQTGENIPAGPNVDVERSEFCPPKPAFPTPDEACRPNGASAGIAHSGQRTRSVGDMSALCSGLAPGLQVAARLNQLLAARLSVPEPSTASPHSLPLRKASLPTSSLYGAPPPANARSPSGHYNVAFRAGSINTGAGGPLPVAAESAGGVAENSDPDSTYTDTRQRPAVPAKPTMGRLLAAPSEDPLDVFPWYHGSIDRAETCRRLLRVPIDGAFLVRRSCKGGKRFANPYSLSLNCAGRVFHLTIRRRADGGFALGFEKTGEQVFAGVDAMIEHHLRNPVCLAECDKAVVLVMVLTKTVVC